MPNNIYPINLLYNDEYFIPITQDKVYDIINGRYIISNYARIFDNQLQRFVVGYMEPFEKVIHVKLFMNHGILDAQLPKLMAIMFHPITAQYPRMIDENSRSLYHKDNIMWSDEEKSKKWADKNIVYKNGQRVHVGEGSILEVKLTDDKVREICKLLQENKLTLKEIGEKFNTSQCCIFGIKKRKTWTHISKDYDFPEVIPKNERYGVNGTTTKYTEEEIRKICELLEQNELSNTDIAKKAGVPKNLVSRIKLGECWASISKDYKMPPKCTQIGDDNNNTLYSDAKIREVCELLEQHKYTIREICDMTNVSYAVVYEVKNGRSRKSISKDYNI